MGYLLFQILLCLILAGILGFLIGWLLKIWPNREQLENLESRIGLLEKSITERNMKIEEEMNGVGQQIEKINGSLSSFDSRFELLNELNDKFNLMEKNYDSRLVEVFKKVNVLESNFAELSSKDLDTKINELADKVNELENKTGSFVTTNEFEKQISEFGKNLNEFNSKLNGFYAKGEVDIKFGEIVSMIATIKDELEEKKNIVNKLSERINEYYSKPETDAKNDLLNAKLKEFEDALNLEKSKVSALEEKLNVYYEKPEIDNKLKEYFAKFNELENKFNSILEERDKTIGELKARLEELSQKEPPKPRIDDLTKISGVGQVLERMLHEQGIYSYEQIAKLTEDEVDRLDEYLKFHDRIRRENWREQARRLHFEKYGEAI